MLPLSLPQRVGVDDYGSDSAGTGTQNAGTHLDSDASSSSGDSDSDLSDSDIEMSDTGEGFGSAMPNDQPFPFCFPCFSPHKSHALLPRPRRLTIAILWIAARCCKVR